MGPSKKKLTPEFFCHGPKKFPRPVSCRSLRKKISLTKKKFQKKIFINDPKGLTGPQKSHKRLNISATSNRPKFFSRCREARRPSEHFAAVFRTPGPLQRQPQDRKHRPFQSALALFAIVAKSLQLQNANIRFTKWAHSAGLHMATAPLTLFGAHLKYRKAKGLPDVRKRFVTRFPATCN